MLPWERKFYQTEIRDIERALNSESPFKCTTNKILWIGSLAGIFMGFGFCVLIFLGFLLAFGIMKILPAITGYPEYYWINGSIAAFLVIMLFIFGIILYIRNMRVSKIKEW